MDGSATQILKPSGSGRRRVGGDPNSPEFEFWMVRNPSFPQPNLHSADELFSGGVLLPLHQLHLSGDAPAEDGEASACLDQSVHKPESSVTESARLSANSNPLTSSKRWKEIFRKGEKKGAEAPVRVNSDDRSSRDVKEKKREKRSSGGAGSGASVAELNINIWPFSRSRSAGNGGTRPRVTSTARKASSAPCSRSNSAGESKSRKWPTSPGRAAGVPVGRSSPVWQVPRRGGGRNSESILKRAERITTKDNNYGRRKIPGAAGGDGSKARAFSLNVPMCIGYRHHLSCRSDENIGGGEGIRGSNLFNIRSLFAKKVY